MSKNPKSTRQPAARPGFNESESPLLRLFNRRDPSGKRYVDEEQLAAGEKLRSDFERSMMSPRVTSVYAEPSGTGGRHWQMSDNRIAHLSDQTLHIRSRVHGALDEVGPELAGILWHVVCLAGGIESAEHILSLPPRSGKAVLSLALTRLARHYGIKHRPGPQSFNPPSAELHRP